MGLRGVLAAAVVFGCTSAPPREQAAPVGRASCPLPLIPWSSTAEAFDPRQTAQVVSDLEEAAKEERAVYADAQKRSKITERLLAQPSYRDFHVSLAATQEVMKLRDLECRVLMEVPDAKAETDLAYAEILGSVQRLRRDLALSNVPPQVHGYDPPSALVH